MPASRVATIGFFDGVHAGHRYLFSQVADIARSRNSTPLLVTFDEHPAAILHPQSAPPLLTTTPERIALLRRLLGRGGSCGRSDAGKAPQIAGRPQGSPLQDDGLLVLPFTPTLAALTAAQFMRQLRDEHNVQTLVLGYDHRFGHDRLTRFTDYQRIGTEEGIEVIQAQPAPQHSPIPSLPPNGGSRRGAAGAASSSTIRRLLLNGQIEAANSLLTYPYFLRGTVITGLHIGHQLGYPTANILPLSPRKLIPANGVYAVDIHTPNADTHTAMLYIGNRPTFGNTERTIEAHLFNFQGNLYDQHIEIRFRRFIREERTFNSPEELRQQLARDQKQIFISPAHRGHCS